MGLCRGVDCGEERGREGPAQRQPAVTDSLVTPPKKRSGGGGVGGYTEGGQYTDPSTSAFPKEFPAFLAKSQARPSCPGSPRGGPVQDPPPGLLGFSL